MFKTHLKTSPNSLVSSYRLGDLVLLELSEYDKFKILVEHPNSIGSKYILEKTRNVSGDNMDIITKIVLETMNTYLDFLPRDIVDSTVIHLRLGDVIAGNEWHEKLKRPLDVDFIKSLVVNDTNKKYVIGKCFFAETSSRNYEQCIRVSNHYLKNVIDEIQGEHFNSGNSDIDLCCAVKSKLFIQGKGYFSKLIVEIRKRLNLPSIETNTHD